MPHTHSLRHSKKNITCFTHSAELLQNDHRVVCVSRQHRGDGAFWGCSGIVALHFPATLQSIDEFAFHQCTGIVELYLPDTLQSIGDSAFQDCTGLASLVLPIGATSIGQGRNYTGAFQGCTSLARVLAPDALARGDMSDPAKVFEGCPVLASGLTPFSAVKPPRRTYWHYTMHAWCTDAAKACVVAVLIAERRVDASAGTRRSRRLGAAPLPSLPHELWLLILEFAPRHELGPPSV